jgi:hypothetical protein
MDGRVALVTIVFMLGVPGISHAQDQSQNQNWHDWNRDDERRDDLRNDYRPDDKGWGRGNNNGNVTETQKRACEPDVFRLCSRSIPNRDAITTCLHNNIDKLNANCRAVMEGRLR